MKVLILNNDFRVYWKGRLLYLRRFLASEGIELFATELFGKGSPYLFDSYNNAENWWDCLFPTKSSHELSSREIETALFYKLNKINPDVVIASPIVLYAGALGMRWAKKNKKKFIMFDDAKFAQFKRNFIVQRVKDLIIKQADGLWLPSAEYYDDYKRLNPKGIHFFNGYSCIDNSLFEFKGNRQLNKKLIICVARLVPVKNIDNLLRAWRLVEQKNTGYQLQIIGDGPNRGSLTALVLELGLQNVEFSGTVGNDGLPSRFHQSAALILPSLSETWGLVVNEAMAAGLPVLLSNRINACQSLLKEGINGYSFDPYNITQMADIISRYMNLTDEAKTRMSAKSIEIIRSVSYENMGIKLVDALIKINSKKIKRTGPIATAVINLWNGKDDRSAWDKL